MTLVPDISCAWRWRATSRGGSTREVLEMAAKPGHHSFRATASKTKTLGPKRLDLNPKLKLLGIFQAIRSQDA